MAPITNPLQITNLEDGETIHQRCLLVTGTCTSTNIEGSYMHVTSKGANSGEIFPEQTWPTAGGNFKALVLLTPGLNILEFAYICNDCLEHTVKISVNYIPLLQCPPLHLAIMTAADSPCIIDCPPHKAAGLSSAHSDLEAAVAKLRMTAYMWQAMTAEDMRLKGLGRRSFRLDEEWAVDTTSREFLNARFGTSLEGAMRSTAKVNIIRSPKTAKDIRDPDVAQQNPRARRDNDLFDYFLDALKTAGGPFIPEACPIVAGLILDSHYDVSQKMILGHAALGCHNREGISLGMFGSHLTYSWPRYLEEVTSCLTDTREPGYKVGNDNGECPTMWEACTIGQGAHLHEVGHAFGSPHRPGIMERGYAQDWPKNFLSQTAYSAHLKASGVTVNMNTPNNARWNLADVLAFKTLPHFHLPTDPILTDEERDAAPQAHPQFDEDNKDSNVSLVINSPSGIARLIFNHRTESQPLDWLHNPTKEIRYASAQLEQLYDRTKPLHLQILALNGKQTQIGNVWKLLSSKTFIRIPGSSIRLTKRLGFATRSDPEQYNHYEWAQLLREKGADGTLHRAVSIDMRVGCLWDGGVVKYADGHKSHWGPMRHYGRTHRFGGHASEKIKLAEGVEITAIEVNPCDGVRMYLSDGTEAGELNNTHSGKANVVRLEPAMDQVIVGFFGKSLRGGFCGVEEFGIITAPREVGIKRLPEEVWELSELKNRAGLDGDDEVAEYNEESQGSEDEEMDYDDE